MLTKCVEKIKNVCKNYIMCVKITKCVEKMTKCVTQKNDFWHYLPEGGWKLKVCSQSPIHTMSKIIVDKKCIAHPWPTL